MGEGGKDREGKGLKSCGKKCVKDIKINTCALQIPTYIKPFLQIMARLSFFLQHQTSGKNRPCFLIPFHFLIPSFSISSSNCYT